MSFPSLWTLQAIRNKIRDITGSTEESQIPDSEINTQINRYYQYTMPNELKVEIENNFLDFKTVPGQDIYDLPQGYFTESPGIYFDGFPSTFYLDPDVFYQDWPQQYAVDIIGTGDGITTGFSGTLQNPPLIISSLFISDNSSVLQSLENGTFSGDGTGTINYTTGAYSINFTTAPSSAQQVYAKYIGYTGNRPSGAMWFQNQLTLRPVPDQVYQGRLQGYIVPASLSSDTDVPLQQEWGPVIAYGVSMEIFSDRSDMGAYNEIFPVFKRYESVALSRTVQELASQQSVPRF